METINNFLTSLENFSSSEFVNKLIKPNTFVNSSFDVKDIKNLKAQILKENENKISSYNIENFENDLNDFLKPIMNIFENPDNSSVTKSFWDLSQEKSPVYICDGFIKVKLPNLPASDFYFLPEYEHRRPDKLFRNEVRVRVVAIKNSFSDLLLSKLEDKIDYFIDASHNLFFDKNNQAFQPDYIDITLRFRFNALEKAA